MPIASANSLEIAYEDYGDQNHPVIFLVQGLGMPQVGWPDAFVQMLVNSGYRVITFDNRDAGHSTNFDGAKRYKLGFEFLRSKIGLKFRSNYSLEDMKDDAVALLDALSIKQAHVVGVSMGGMIAQLIAIHAPDRVLSLTSIMSTTGHKRLRPATKHVLDHIMKGPPSLEIKDRIPYNIKTWELIGSPDYPMTDEERETFVHRILDYGSPIYGVGRQTLAIVAAKHRRDQLQKLTVPTLVIHGDSDPLVPVEGGIDTAEHITGAKLEIIKGMGHDLPNSLLPTLHALITDHTNSI